jgi:hypothetical protein
MVIRLFRPIHGPRLFLQVLTQENSLGNLMENIAFFMSINYFVIFLA